MGTTSTFRVRWYPLAFGAGMIAIGVWLGYLTKPRSEDTIFARLVYLSFCVDSCQQVGDALIKSLHDKRYSQAREMFDVSSQSSYTSNALKDMWASVEREIGIVHSWNVRRVDSSLSLEQSIDCIILYDIFGNKGNGSLKIHLKGSCNRPLVINIRFTNSKGALEENRRPTFASTRTPHEKTYPIKP